MFSQSPRAKGYIFGRAVDRGRRDHNISLVVREWKNHDLAAAIAFVQTTPALDNNLRQRLLR